MADCLTCKQEMLDQLPCTDPLTVTIDGETFSRIPYDTSHRTGPGPFWCHDCAAPAGALHHPGCDMERCPACGGQAISCGDKWEGIDD